MTIYGILTDFFFLAALLLIAQFLRAKVGFFQKILMPPAMIAGILGLILGPQVLNVIPWSEWIGKYADVLIIIVFGSTMLGKQLKKKDILNRNVGGMFVEVTGLAFVQYFVGMFVTTYVIVKIWPEVNPGIGLGPATGFYGAFGTASSVGSIYADVWPEAKTLMTTFAALGMLFAIILGMIAINMATRRGITHYVKDPKALPMSMKSGVIAPEDQKKTLTATTSSISLESLAFHLCIMLVPAGLGYYLNVWMKTLPKAISQYAIPAFCGSLIAAFFVNLVIYHTPAQKYVDESTISSLRGGMTDLLCASAISSLNLSVVAEYAGPLVILCVVGIIASMLWLHFFGTGCSRSDRFERNIMTWGHGIGASATGILLYRVVDPEDKSNAIAETGIAQVLNRIPICIAIATPPVMLIANAGSAGKITWVFFACFVVCVVLAIVLKWWTKAENKYEKYE